MIIILVNKWRSGGFCMILLNYAHPASLMNHPPTYFGLPRCHGTDGTLQGACCFNSFSRCSNSCRATWIAWNSQHDGWLKHGDDGDLTINMEWYIYIYICTYVYIYVCVHICMFIYVCTYIYIYSHIRWDITWYKGVIRVHNPILRRFNAPKQNPGWVSWGRYISCVNPIDQEESLWSQCLPFGGVVDTQRCCALVFAVGELADVCNQIRGQRNTPISWSLYITINYHENYPTSVGYRILRSMIIVLATYAYIYYYVYHDIS